MRPRFIRLVQVAYKLSEQELSKVHDLGVMGKELHANLLISQTCTVQSSGLILLGGMERHLTAQLPATLRHGKGLDLGCGCQWCPRRHLDMKHNVLRMHSQAIPMFE